MVNYLFLPSGKKKKDRELFLRYLMANTPQWTAHSPSTMPNIPDYSLVSPRNILAVSNIIAQV